MYRTWSSCRRVHDLLCYDLIALARGPHQRLLRVLAGNSIGFTGIIIIRNGLVSADVHLIQNRGA